MIWLLKYWKGIALAVMVAGAGLVGYVKGADSVQAKCDADVLRLVKAQLAKNQEDAAKLKKLQETANENLDYVSNLYFGLGKSQRLRLPVVPCGGSNPPGADSPAGGGKLPEGTTASAEQAINQYDETYRSEAYRADRLIEECRLLNDYFK